MYSIKWGEKLSSFVFLFMTKEEPMLQKGSHDKNYISPHFLKCRATKRAKRIEEFVKNTSQPFPVFEFVSIRASVPLVSLIHTGSCTIMSHPVFSIIFAPTLQNVRKSMFDSYLKDITVSNYSLSPRLFFFSFIYRDHFFFP